MIVDRDRCKINWGFYGTDAKACLSGRATMSTLAVTGSESARVRRSGHDRLAVVTLPVGICPSTTDGNFTVMERKRDCTGQSATRNITAFS
jgi:hypothetical protein